MVPRLLLDVYVLDATALELIYTYTSFSQPVKALFPMSLTLVGMVTDVRPVQAEKALSPMLVTLLGMVMDVKPLQE